MRQTLTVTALLAMTFLAAPAGAQIAGNPGDLHNATPYMAQQWTSQRAAPDTGHDVNMLAPFSALTSAFWGKTSTPSGQHGCAASQDFNGRYTSTCAP